MNKKSDGEMAVVYARFSSSNQQEQSIEGQLAAAKKYAEAKGYTIIREYCDRAKTGTNDNREEFQRMLSDCAKKQFTVIIVWKVDRFGRNREEITFNKYRAKKNGVRVEYVAENVGEGPESVILESVLEGMAEYYSLQLSQNVKRGQLEGAKKRHVLGGRPPFGYRTAADKTYELDPETAPIAKLIFEKYAEGMTEAEISRWLNDQGYRTIKGKMYSRTSLVKLLKNERYIGTYIFKDLIREENAMPAIIDKDLFEKVQEMLAKNKRLPSNKWNYSDYILTDKLYCGLCGSQMVGVSGTSKSKKKHCYYACLSKHKKQGCEKKLIRQDFLESLVLEQIHLLLHDQNLFDFIVEKTWECYQKQDQTEAEIRSLENQLAAAEKGLANLVKTIEAGIFNDIIQNRINELEAQRTAIKKSLAEIRISEGIKLTEERIRFFLERFRDMDETDRACQKRLISTFVNSIFLYDDKLTIAYNYSGSNNTVTVRDLEEQKTTASEVFKCSRQSVPWRQSYEHLTIRCLSRPAVILVEIKIPAA